MNDGGARRLIPMGIDTSVVGQVDGQNGQTQDMYFGSGTSETC